MKYYGSFIKGLSGGVSSGLSMVMNMQQLKWQKEQMKQLEKDKEAYKEAIGMFQTNNQDLFDELGTQSTGDSGLSLITNAFAISDDFGRAVKEYTLAINSNNREAAKQAHEKMQLITEYMLKLQLGGGELAESWSVEDFVSEESKKWIRARDVYKATPTATMPYEMTKEMAGMAGFKDMPETMPIAPTKLTDTQVKLAEIDKLTFLTEKRRNQMKVDMLSKSDSATAEKVKAIKAAGGTNEDVLRALSGEAKVTGVTEPKPETVATLVKWEEMFDIKAEEGPKTEEEYNRALELLAQSEDAYKPKYATWKEALIAEAKGIAKELKGITNKEDHKLLLGIYMQKLEEIKAKYPEVDLNQFPVFEEQKNWFQKLLDWGK